MTSPKQISKTNQLLSLIAERQSILKKGDDQLARELGLERAVDFTMIKEGKVKLPLRLIPPLAVALEVEPAMALRLALSDSMPELLQAFNTLFTPMVLTANEIRLVEAYRYLSKGRDIEPMILDGENIIALVSS